MPFAALPQKSVSFTPGFSPVERAVTLFRNRFNGFHGETKGKPLKRLPLMLHSWAPG
jgi:hypothetical protein